jgi:UDP-N-acetylglucosamine--N-acetylmuramyl-(pentapeptide) pyrophosphoryl-undecaprenol N-acetylglucosamine transferase
MRALVAGGGTGGHVYPALAVLEELRAGGNLSHAGWVGNPAGLEAKILRNRLWIEFFPLPSRGVDRRRPWTWPGRLLQVLVSVARAIAIVRRFRPDVVLGAGGHAAFAPVVAGRVLRVPTAVLEQNARMGLANRVLSRLVDLVLLSFPATTGVPRRARVRVTGNPVRGEVARVPHALGDELLVVGGSLGSRPLVEAMVRAAPDLARSPGLRLRLVVGESVPVDEVERELAQAGVTAEVVRYVDRFAEALSRARLVVARAGATTVAELAAAGRPAVFVPWAGAAENHQHDNAWAAARSGGCLVVEDRDLTRPDFGNRVTELWLDERRLRDMAKAARISARPDAARLAATALLALVEGKRT